MSDLVEAALLRGSLDHCVKCTICETQCPVVERLATVPGAEVRRPAGRALTGSADDPSVDLSVDYCSGCGICSHGVPAGRQDRGDQLPGAQQAEGARRACRCATGSSPGPPGSGRAGTPVAPIANFTLGFGPPAILGEKLLGVHRDAAGAEVRRAALLALGDGPFQRRAAWLGHKIVYFHGCGTEYYEPWEGEKVVAILEHNGFEVIVPKQDCCGLPLQSRACSTMPARWCCELARNLAPHVGDEDTIIVGNATSCTLMLKREAREILSLEDDPALKRVSERTYDICELLLELHDRGELRPTSSR